MDQVEDEGMSFRARRWAWWQRLRTGDVDWTKYSFKLEEFKGEVDEEMYASLIGFRNKERAQRRARVFMTGGRAVGYVLVVIGWWTVLTWIGSGQTVLDYALRIGWILVGLAGLGEAIDRIDRASDK
jgi:hypothetical protein